MESYLDSAIRRMHPGQLFPDVGTKYKTMSRRARRANAFMDSLIHFNDFEDCAQHMADVLRELRTYKQELQKYSQGEFTERLGYKVDDLIRSIEARLDLYNDVRIAVGDYQRRIGL